MSTEVLIYKWEESVQWLLLRISSSIAALSILKILHIELIKYLFKLVGNFYFERLSVWGSRCELLNNWITEKDEDDNRYVHDERVERCTERCFTRASKEEETCMKSDRTADQREQSGEAKQSLFTVHQCKRKGLNVASSLDSGLGAGRVTDCFSSPKIPMKFCEFLVHRHYLAPSNHTKLCLDPMEVGKAEL